MEKDDGSGSLGSWFVPDIPSRGAAGGQSEPAGADCQKEYLTMNAF